MLHSKTLKSLSLMLIPTPHFFHCLRRSSTPVMLIHLRLWHLPDVQPDDLRALTQLRCLQIGACRKFCALPKFKIWSIFRRRARVRLTTERSLRSVNLDSTKGHGHVWTTGGSDDSQSRHCVVLQRSGCKTEKPRPSLHLKKQLTISLC